MTYNKIWLKVLPILFLLATFEHCYYILHLYNGGLLFPEITTVLLVLAIDISIYYSMQFFDLLPARLILIMSGSLSIALNVKYMIDWKPAGVFGVIIAVAVGLLIPLMLCLFGWLEKAIRESIIEADSNGKLRHLVKYHVAQNPGLSNRKLASLIGCSHTTVSKYRNE